jgi:hypothetical protein
MLVAQPTQSRALIGSWSLCGWQTGRPRCEPESPRSEYLSLTVPATRAEEI